MVERPGLRTIPHTSPDKILIGGPSNSGGLFINWALGLLGDAEGPVVRAEYPSGPRTCGASGSRTTTPISGVGSGTSTSPNGQASIRRAAFEASGFAVRHMCDLGEAEPGRSSPPVVGRGSRRSRRWPIAPSCRSTSSPFPRAPRWERRFLVRSVSRAGDEQRRCRAVGSYRPHDRPHPVDRPGRRAGRPVPAARRGATGVATTSHEACVAGERRAPWVAGERRERGVRGRGTQRTDAGVRLMHTVRR